MIRRLRWKFVLIAMLSLFMVLAIIMVTINALSYKGVIDKADETLDIIAEGGAFPQIPLIPGLPHQRSAAREIPLDSRFFITAFSESGDPVFVIKENISFISDESAVYMAERALDDGEERGFLGNYRYLIRVDGGGFTRVIFLDCTSALATNRNFILISVTISGVGLLAVFLLLFFLSKLVTDPVSESVEKQKRFITDAGHELKTPLTVIDADAELIAMENGESEWVADIKQQTKRLAALTNDLIYLSRMEEESYELPFVELPLADIVSEIAQSFTSIFKTNGKNFDTRIEKMLTVKGDEKSLCQLVSILLDNAVKYSCEGDFVELELKKQGRYACLSVTNRAEDMTKEKAERLFDRFYRGDKSREQRSGYGLGLSIARAITEAHKGKITASVKENERLEITAFLPL